MRRLRRLRGEHALLVALADCGGVWGVVEVTAALSGFADLRGRLTGGLSLDGTQYTYALQTVNGADIGTFTFDTSLVGADNVLVMAVVDGASHLYPNGTNHPVVMADVLWRFFERYTLP